MKKLFLIAIIILLQSFPSLSEEKEFNYEQNKEKLIEKKLLQNSFKNIEENVSKLSTGKVFYSTKIIKPSPEELKNHQIYLKTSLKKNYF